MSPSHVMKGNVRYRYYVSSAVARGCNAEAGTIKRVSANLIENAVLHAPKKHTKIDIDDADQASAFNHISLRVDLRAAR